VTLALVAGLAVLGSATAASAATSYDVIATVPMGNGLGDGIGIDTVNRSLYISRPGANVVSVVDLTTNTIATTIPVNGPGRIAVDTSNHRAYVVSAGSLAVIDTTSNTVVGSIGGLSNPIGVAVDPGTHTVYVANYNSQLISVINTTTTPATLTNTDIAGSRPWAVDVDPTTHKAYAATLFGGTVAVVSGTSITNTVGGFAGPIQVTVDPIAHRAYVVNNNFDGVSMINTTTEQNLGTFSAGSGPTDMAVDPTTTTGYVTNRNTDDVSVIDLTDHSVIGTVPVGDNPQSVEVDPTTHRAYVMNTDNTISVIALRTSQAITFTSLPTSRSVGGSYTVDTLGGGSTQPVTLSIAPGTTNAACSIVGNVVSFDHAGTCLIAADQAGNDGFRPAPTAIQEVAVELEATTTLVTLPSSSVVFGQPATATVAVGNTHAGSVQFTLDGASLGSAVPLQSDGTATSPELTDSDLAVGAHPVGAIFTPTDTNRYAGSSATPKTLTVNQAATTSVVSVDANSVVADVTPTAPGAGVPTGTVRFYLVGTEIGSAGLAYGRATLTHRVPAGSTREISTIYSGDAAFTGSSASTARRDPVITASASSPQARHNGWYAAPVTVTFQCEQTSAALTAACPAPVTLSHSAAGQSVTRTIMATDGGAATVVLRSINIDRVRPAVRVTGVRAGGTYFATGPHGGCRAGDRLSGVATCTVTRATHRNHIAYVATATDRAGNRSTSRLVVRSTSVAISGASMRHGHYVVHRGRTYTVLVASATRPSYIYAAPSPRRPAGGNIPFERLGKNRWALGATFKQSMSHHTWWNIGTRVGSHTTVTRVQVVR
jgi:YVTN family beta-propeller protein